MRSAPVPRAGRASASRCRQPRCRGDAVLARIWVRVRLEQERSGRFHLLEQARPSSPSCREYADGRFASRQNEARLQRPVTVEHEPILAFASHCPCSQVPNHSASHDKETGDREPVRRVVEHFAGLSVPCNSNSDRNTGFSTTGVEKGGSMSAPVRPPVRPSPPIRRIPSPVPSDGHEAKSTCFASGLHPRVRSQAEWISLHL